MIKFFRRIRKKLLSDLPAGKAGNRLSKYLVYAGGEIILVMIGILLALQVNNWNENKKTEATKQDYYQQLLKDLAKDKVYALETIELFTDRRAKYKDYRDAFHNSQLTLKEVYDKILSLNFNSKPVRFNSNTIETLENSGEIVLIPTDIRNKLINLKNFQNTITANALFNDQHKNNILQRTFSLFGNIDFQNGIVNQKQLQSLRVTDDTRKDVILGWENMHMWKDVSENQSINLSKELLNDIEEIEQLIKKEIKK